MRKRISRVEILHQDDMVLEIRYWGPPNDSRFLSWHMQPHEAKALAKWWTDTGCTFKKNDLPINGYRNGPVIVSMVVLSIVEIRTLNRHGGLEQRGCSLPRDVVEHLASWLDQSGRYVHHPQVRS